jgi:RHS repeat-associated protein
VYAAPSRGDREYGKGGRLLEADGTEFRYDAAGNRRETTDVLGATTRYHWNCAGELATVELPDGKHVSFEYDALRRRTCKRVYDSQGDRPVAEVRWTWDGVTPLTEFDSERGATTWLFEPETFNPLAKLAAGKIWGVLPDHLGTPTELVREDGNVDWRGESDSFSGVDPREQTTQCPFRWPGQYQDQETGLHYNRFRYYDPKTGLYISQDPIGLAGGLHPYGYVPDPNAWIDPLGLAFQTVDFTGSPDLYPTGALGPGQQNVVAIQMQGSRGRDFTEANRLAGFQNGTPRGHTWHHVADFDPATGTCSMQLVTTAAHEATFPHMGSVAQFERHFGVRYSASGGAVDIVEQAGYLRNPRRQQTPRGGCG